MLKHKIRQMLIMGCVGTEFDANEPVMRAAAVGQLGGVILFANNVRSPEQMQQLASRLKNNASETPLFVGMDYEGGTVSRLSEQAGFTKTLTAADMESLPENEVQYHALHMAKTLSTIQINLNFAPVLDVNVNPNNPIIGARQRSFSSDPYRVANRAAIFAKTYQDHGIVSVFKHFPGHGSSTGDTHVGFVDVSDTWQLDELIPYQTLLPNFSDAVMVMTAHVVHRGLDTAGLPASLSSAMTTKLLRSQLGFKGVVVTDDMQMKAITDQYGLEDALRLAINAGADMLVFGNQLTAYQEPEELVDMIDRLVNINAISAGQIEAAYQRISKLKHYLSITI